MHRPLALFFAVSLGQTAAQLETDQISQAKLVPAAKVLVCPQVNAEPETNGRHDQPPLVPVAGTIAAIAAAAAAKLRPRFAEMPLLDVGVGLGAAMAVAAALHLILPRHSRSGPKSMAPDLKVIIIAKGDAIQS